jgi:hypothetical protein
MVTHEFDKRAGKNFRAGFGRRAVCMGFIHRNHGSWNGRFWPGCCLSRPAEADPKQSLC